MFIDTHCHLNSEQLNNQIDDILIECQRVGVGLIIVPGYTLETSKKALEIAEKYDHVYAVIGYHPTEIKNYGDMEYQWLEEHMNHPKVIGVGEIGLDYHWDVTTKEEQRYAFIKQIEIAKKYHKPIIIHSRDALLDTLNILKETNASLVGGIMHSYAGSAEMSEDFIKLNFLISLGGPVTFLNAKTPKEVAAYVSLNNLLTETDSPYLAPHPLRGTTNVPMNVCLVAKTIAEIKGITIDELNKQVLKNVNRLFNLEVLDEN